MAPPPPSNMPLQQRLLQLAQTLQFGWFAGHVTLLLMTFRYALSYITFNYNSRWARFSYRTAFIAAAVTYGIVVFKSFRARQRSGKGHGGALAIAGDENVQYLIMALVWLFSRQTPLAILPFAVYSIFHVATYTRSNLLPTLQPQQSSAPGEKPKPSALADTIGRFVKEYYDTSMTVVAVLEIALWFRLLGSAVLFQKGSWILILLYTVFLRARFHQSTFVQGATNHLVARGDAIANRQDMPPAVRQGWDAVKNGVRKAGEMTDINRYAQGQPQQAKKAQ
ncbi:Transmembrane nucleoporin [Taxawa tesnikishii (nom. ined.)]|nr:Transmembrane nucleoporin [Dothideales sp. JES 119]